MNTYVFFKPMNAIEGRAREPQRGASQATQAALPWLHEEKAKLRRVAPDSQGYSLNLADARTWHSCAYGQGNGARRYQLEYLLGMEAIVAHSLAGAIPPKVPACFIAARQSGKNQSNAYLESRFLSLYSTYERELEIVKAAPTWKPQALISKERLQRVMNTPLFTELLKPRWSEGYQCHIGRASLKLVSADPKAHNVGLSATLMLSADEAQDIDPERWAVNFSPMTLDTGAPCVMSGTSWRTDSLLEQQRELASDMQKKLGFRLLYVFPWDRIAEEHPRYGQQVQQEIDRYGEDHILIQTQFCCRPIDSAGMLLNSTDLALLAGDHERQVGPRDGRVYVAGVDFAAMREQDDEELLRNPQARKSRDSTVVTIGELVYRIDRETGRKLPIIRVVDQLWVEGLDPQAATDTIYRYIFETWRCSRCVLDANGVGSMPSEIIRMRRPAACTALHLSATIKSRLGYDLQGAIKTDRLKMYRDDGSAEWRESRFQLRQCRRLEVRESLVMRWGAPRVKIDGKDVHDDFALSLAYCLEAAQEHLAAHHDPNEYAQRGILSQWSFDVFQ